MEIIPGTGLEQPAQGWFRQLFRYAVVGGIATVVDLAIFTFLAIHLGINYLVAVPLSFVTATAVNFLLCLKFVFRLKGLSPAVAAWRKLLSSSLALAVNLAAMFVMVDVLAFDQIEFAAPVPIDGLFFARCLAICVAFSINFLLTKYYAFRDY